MRVSRITFESAPPDSQELRTILNHRWCAACSRQLVVPFVMVDLPQHRIALHVECAIELSHTIYMDAIFDSNHRCAG